MSVVAEHVSTAPQPCMCDFSLPPPSLEQQAREGKGNEKSRNKLKTRNIQKEKKEHRKKKGSYIEQDRECFLGLMAVEMVIGKGT